MAKVSYSWNVPVRDIRRLFDVRIGTITKTYKHKHEKDIELTLKTYLHTDENNHNTGTKYMGVFWKPSDTMRNVSNFYDSDVTIKVYNGKKCIRKQTIHLKDDTKHDWCDYGGRYCFREFHYEDNEFIKIIIIFKNKST